jgi:hypothetical protein
MRNPDGVVCFERVIERAYIRSLCLTYYNEGQLWMLHCSYGPRELGVRSARHESVEWHWDLTDMDWPPPVSGAIGSR